MKPAGDKIILYHGSKNIIEKPVFRGGKETNDYGYGFYCTEHMELANEWACPDDRDGYTNEYELDLSGLRVLDLTGSPYTILNWIALLLQFRMPSGLTPNDEQVRNYLLDWFSVDLRSVDIIKGYRADDSYFSFARDFVRNSITVSQLSQAMELGKLGVQVVLHSERSFGHLKFIQYHAVDGKEYYMKRHARDLKAREEYSAATRNIEVGRDDLFVMDIIRQEVKNDDPRIQRPLRR